MFGIARASGNPFFTHARKEGNELFFTVSNGTPKGVWYTIHSLAATNNHEVLIGLLSAFATSFMCVKCMLHMREYISQNPPPSIEACRENRRTLFDWTIAFRNAVSERVRVESGYAGYIFTPDDANRMLEELTTTVERNKIKYATSGDCDGCVNPAVAKAPKATPNTRWVRD